MLKDLHTTPTRVLLVGAGGLGCAAGLVLAQSARHLGPLSLTILDDDVVSADNLHRQLFFRDEDVGLPKAALVAARLVEEARAHGAMDVEASAVPTRFLPSNARALVAEHDLVIEGADNYATKFLVCDAARLERKRAIHAGVVRWVGYALTSGPESHGCYRCLFEDLPRGRPDTCALAGVVGPLVALVGSIEAEFLVDALLERTGAREAGGGRYVHVDALRGGAIRERALPRRHDCPTCGDRPSVLDIDASRYTQAICD